MDYILDNYPRETPLNVLLEEENPGTIPFTVQEKGQESEHALVVAHSQ